MVGLILTRAVESIVIYVKREMFLIAYSSMKLL